MYQCIMTNCAGAPNQQLCAQQNCSTCINTTTTTEFNAIPACEQSNCASQCGIPTDGGTDASSDGGVCAPAQTTTSCNQVDIAGADGGSSCSTCMHGACCSDLQACFGDSTCAELYQCLVTNCAGITNQTAFQTCVSQKCGSCDNPAAEQAITNFSVCEQNNCAIKCGIYADAGM